MKIFENEYQGGGQKFGDKGPKVWGQTDKSSGTLDKSSETPDKSLGTLPLSDFAFFVLKIPKNAKSEGVVSPNFCWMSPNFCQVSPNFCRSVLELLVVCPRTFASP